MNIVGVRGLMNLAPCYSGDYGCIVNGQLVVDRTDPVGGNRGVMMKLCIGTCVYACVLT